jgi:hypothetical protein
MANKTPLSNTHFFTWPIKLPLSNTHYTPTHPQAAQLLMAVEPISNETCFFIETCYFFAS